MELEAAELRRERTAMIEKINEVEMELKQTRNRLQDLTQEHAEAVRVNDELVSRQESRQEVIRDAQDVTESNNDVIFFASSDLEKENTRVSDSASSLQKAKQVHSLVKRLESLGGREAETALTNEDQPCLSSSYVRLQDHRNVSSPSELDKTNRQSQVLYPLSPSQQVMNEGITNDGNYSHNSSSSCGNGSRLLENKLEKLSALAEKLLGPQQKHSNN